MSRESDPPSRWGPGRPARRGAGRLWWLGVLCLLLLSGGVSAGETATAWAEAMNSGAVGSPAPVAPLLSSLAMPPSQVATEVPSQGIPREKAAQALLRCQGTFLVITHRAGWPLPPDEERVRELLARIFLRLDPEWPDGLPAYPIARPAGHPASRMLQQRVFQRTAAELAHHWEVMSRRFGQQPPPVVGSARLLLRLIARQPGAVGIVSADELPAPAFWPREVRIAAVLGARRGKRMCSRQLLETLYAEADGASGATSSRAMAAAGAARGDRTGAHGDAVMRNRDHGLRRAHPVTAGHKTP